ncbi:hypothetical protein [Nannocystis punicea]|uniref:Uncharacterized protein n=1 Tax=Nannocystis punicea TaxID=2995304 RepID=A0ABY7H565_9BACT|nr:hypothetical protein [Nannocystis poenicansa]WAS94426.1 hypothetical protein O0S08_50565 [Nannocystis poenicansa]
MRVAVSEATVVVHQGPIVHLDPELHPDFEYFGEPLLLGSWALGGEDPLTAVAYLVKTKSVHPPRLLAEVWFWESRLGRRLYGAFRIDSGGEPYDEAWRHSLRCALHERLFPPPDERASFSDAQ